MRTIVTSFLLLAAAPWVALAQPGAAPPSASNLVRLHPGPWRMTGTSVMGMRFDPETGEAFAVEGTREASALALASQAQARVLAAQNITRRADGSRHAVLGAAFRAYEVVTIDADGRLTQDCVSTEAEARARVQAGAPKQARK
jgi:hypothetical protein